MTPELHVVSLRQSVLGDLRWGKERCGKKASFVALTLDKGRAPEGRHLAFPGAR